jgi:hypothetical protein
MHLWDNGTGETNMSMNNKLRKLYERRSESRPFYVGFSSTEDSIRSAVLREVQLQNELKKSMESTGLSENEYWVYESMKEVGEQYRTKSYSESKKISNKLREYGMLNVDFDYQGSVTNNTCIRDASDIDLLVITNDFYELEPPLKPSRPYTGDPLQELKEIRKDCINIIRESFNSSKLDATKSKCTSVSKGTLQRDIDVVVCNWFYTVQYNNTNEEFQKGIQVLDLSENRRIINLPFLHNKLLDDKDIWTNGKYKSFVRLIKSVKSDADEDIDISSYEITSLLYHMRNMDILGLDHPCNILFGISKYFTHLYYNKNELSQLFVPNKTVRIIDSLKMNAFASLINEINDLAKEL